MKAVKAKHCLSYIVSFIHPSSVSVSASSFLHSSSPSHAFIVTVISVFNLLFFHPPLSFFYRPPPVLCIFFSPLLSLHCFHSSVFQILLFPLTSISLFLCFVVPPHLHSFFFRHLPAFPSFLSSFLLFFPPFSITFIMFFFFYLYHVPQCLNYIFLSVLYLFLLFFSSSYRDLMHVG